MKAKHRLVLFITFLFTVLSLQALTQQTGPDQERIRRSTDRGRPEYAPHPETGMEAGANSGYAADHILVKFNPLLTTQHVDSIVRAYGSRTSQMIPVVGLYRVDIPEGSTVVEMLEVWSQNYFVEYAKPDYIARIAVTPNDLFFSDQYAVIDTGVDLLHPDLVNKIASSGKDFVNGDDDATDDHWHGTAVAGIAAAESNNGIGIAGVAWNCMILPVKVMIGGSIDDPDLEAAVVYAYQNGAVVVASSGNDGSSVSYPAAYDGYVLAVASTDMDDMRPPSSNFGPEVDVAAPGELIRTTYPTWDTPAGFYPYILASGTSFATPHVSGMAALIMSIKPWMEVSDLMKVIRYTADDVNADEYPGPDDYIGYGRINLDTALVPIPIKK
jgi:subtilisin family serine protease